MIEIKICNSAYTKRYADLVEYLAKHYYNTRDGLHIGAIYKTWDELPDDTKDFYRDQQDHLAELLIKDIIRPAFFDGFSFHSDKYDFVETATKLGYNE